MADTETFKVTIEWADGTFAPLRDPVTGIPREFASREAALAAGNEFCDEAESHPVAGAPGFSVEEARHG
jgi:hypothetical protein